MHKDLGRKYKAVLSSCNSKTSNIQFYVMLCNFVYNMKHSTAGTFSAARSTMQRGWSHRTAVAMQTGQLTPISLYNCHCTCCLVMMLCHATALPVHFLIEGSIRRRVSLCYGGQQTYHKTGAGTVTKPVVALPRRGVPVSNGVASASTAGAAKGPSCFSSSWLDLQGTIVCSNVLANRMHWQKLHVPILRQSKHVHPEMFEQTSDRKS